jgi:hypothetical protein
VVRKGGGEVRIYASFSLDTFTCSFVFVGNATMQCALWYSSEISIVHGLEVALYAS